MPFWVPSAEISLLDAGGDRLADPPPPASPISVYRPPQGYACSLNDFCEIVAEHFRQLFPIRSLSRMPNMDDNAGLTC